MTGRFKLWLKACTKGESKTLCVCTSPGPELLLSISSMFRLTYKIVNHCCSSPWCMNWPSKSFQTSYGFYTVCLEWSAQWVIFRPMLELSSSSNSLCYGRKLFTQISRNPIFVHVMLAVIWLCTHGLFPMLGVRSQPPNTSDATIFLWAIHTSWLSLWSALHHQMYKLALLTHSRPPRWYVLLLWPLHRSSSGMQDRPTSTKRKIRE